MHRRVISDTSWHKAHATAAVAMQYGISSESPAVSGADLEEIRAVLADLRQDSI